MPTEGGPDFALAASMIEADFVGTICAVTQREWRRQTIDPVIGAGRD